MEVVCRISREWGRQPHPGGPELTVDDLVFVRIFKRRWAPPKVKGPGKILAATSTAVRVNGIGPWVRLGIPQGPAWPPPHPSLPEVKESPIGSPMTRMSEGFWSRTIRESTPRTTHQSMVTKDLDQVERIISPQTTGGRKLIYSPSSLHMVLVQRSLPIPGDGIYINQNELRKEFSH
ncbi:unnamed protein product [Arctogadus glacialis]